MRRLRSALLFVAPNLAGWIQLVALGSGTALPGVLLWLLATCGLKRALGELPGVAQASVAVLLGAACALVGAAPSVWLSTEVVSPFAWLAPALAGAAFAAVLYMWLQLRAQATLPADTTARLAELQSRIRPHFLFNTLNTALALVRLDPARAEGVLEDLAELFRVAISDSSESVSLAEEVTLAQRYLAIEQIRFGERLQVSWELDADAGAARVPPLLLQPLVENAVRHGIEPARGRRHDPRAHAGQGRAGPAVDRQHRARHAVEARQRHRAAQCARTAAPDARCGRAVRRAP